MSNPHFNVGDELTRARCSICDDVVWTEYKNHRIVCQCGALYLHGARIVKTRGEKPLTDIGFQAVFDDAYTKPVPDSKGRR